MPVRTISSDKEYFAEFHADRQLIAAYFKANPAVFISGLYFLCSIAGLIYLAVLHQGFDIPVLAYLELTDFLMAFIANPSIYIAMAGFTSFILFLYVLSRWFPHWFEAKAEAKWYNSWKPFYGIRMYKLVLLLVVIPLFLYAFTVASHDVEYLQSDSASKHRLDLNYPITLTNAAKVQQVTVTLISLTSRFAFALPEGQSKPITVPVHNIAALQPLPTSEASSSITPSTEPNVNNQSNLSSLLTDEPSEPAGLAVPQRVAKPKAFEENAVEANISTETKIN